MPNFSPNAVAYLQVSTERQSDEVHTSVGRVCASGATVEGRPAFRGLGGSRRTASRSPSPAATDGSRSEPTEVTFEPGPGGELSKLAERLRQEVGE